jgi:hypothetical protein
MTTVDTTATFNSVGLPGPSPKNRRTNAGAGSDPNTESSTVLSGQGWARLMMVSTTMATATTNSHRQYGRTRLREKRSTPADPTLF